MSYKRLFQWAMLITVAILSGCQPNAGRAVTPEAKPISIDAPRWIEVDTAVPTTLAIRPDGRQVIVSAPPVTHAYELPSGKRLHTWTQPLEQAAYSNDGTTLLGVSRSQAAVWETASFHQRQSFPSRRPQHDHFGTIVSIAISSGGSHVAIEDRSGTTVEHRSSILRVFKCADASETFTRIVPDSHRIESLDFTSGNASDATRLLVQISRFHGSKNQSKCEYWDLESGQLVEEFPSESRVLVSPNRRWIAVGQPQQTGQPAAVEVAIHDVATGETRYRTTQPGFLRDWVFHPNDPQLLIVTEVTPPAMDAADNNHAGNKDTDNKDTDNKDAGTARSKTPIGRITQWNFTASKITMEQTHAECPFASAMYDAEGARVFATIAQPGPMEDDVDYHLIGWDAKGAFPIRTMAGIFSVNRIERLFFLPDSDRLLFLSRPFSPLDVTTGETSSPLPRYRVSHKYVSFQSDAPEISYGGRYTSPRSTHLVTGTTTRSAPIGQTHHWVQNGTARFSSQHPSLALFDVESDEPYWSLYLESSLYAARDTKITADAKTIVRSQPTDDDSIGQSRVMIVRPEQPDAPLILHRYASHIAIDPVTNRRFATASDRSIEEFDISNGERLGKIADVPGRVLGMTYTPDGSRIAACGVIEHRDPKIRFRNSDPGWAAIYQRESGRRLELKGHTAAVTSIAIDAPRGRCATSSHDGTVRLWGLETGRCLHVYRGHHGEIDCVDINSDGRLLASAGADGIAVWNVAGVVDSEITPVEIAEDFTFVETRPRTNLTPSNPTSSSAPIAERRSSPANNSQRWEVVEVGDVSRVSWHNNAVEEWLKQNRDADTVLRVPEIRSRPGLPESVFAGPDSQSSDGKRRLYMQMPERAVKVFDDEHREIQNWPFRVDRRHAVISTDGEHVLILRAPERSGANQKDEPPRIQIDVYDVESGERVRTITGTDARWINALKIDPMGKTLVVHFDNNNIEVLDVETGRSIAVLESTMAGAGRSSSYSPDGKWIAIGKYPSPDIVLYDASTMQPVQTIVNDLPVRWFRFTPDGRRLLAGQPYARSRTLLTMWEFDSSDPSRVRRLWSHAGPAGEEGMFSDDGNRYLCSANWNMWTLWDTNQGHVDVVVITRSSNVKDQFVLSPNGKVIQFHAPDRPPVWPQPSSSRLSKP